MNKEKLLTVRWNNLLSLGLGIVVLIYAAFALSTSLASSLGGFLGLVVIGVLYWVIVEQHATMRFAWLRERSGNDVPPKQSATNRIIVIVYNVIWWIPIVLPFIKVIDYRTGFVAFLAITIIRALANLFRNNVLKGEQAENFPLRAP